jgi:magnesium chelatase subunit D
MTQRKVLKNSDRAGRRASPQAYPFFAIVGQEEMKLALLLNVIDPLIGGVLIMGHRGTGKSTAVRAIADLLPHVWSAVDCEYGCDPSDEENLCDGCYETFRKDGKLARVRSQVPVVTIPLGATEDRVCGSIDIQRALKDGIKAFEPGLLASANRGFLYVDEVNLLDDHLVDLLLDVAVTGRNKVEREGISLEHPSRFVLVGSGNPEEGELRPQLVDRFGLCAEVRTLEDLDQRVEIVKLREAFENDAARFRTKFEAEQEKLRRRIVGARKQTNRVTISKEFMQGIAGLCLKLRIDGHRGELTIARAARALAAFEGRRKVTDDDVRRVAPLALRHRLRRDPLEPNSGGSGRVEQALEIGIAKTKSAGDKSAASRSRVSNQKLELIQSNGVSNLNGTSNGRRSGDERLALAPPPKMAQLPDEALKQSSVSIPQYRSGNESARKHRNNGGASYNSRRGRYSRAVMHGSPTSKIALDATLRATALNASRNYRKTIDVIDRLTTPFALRPIPRISDLRYKVFKRKQGTLFIMAIDTSGSMAANRIDRAKGALVWLLGKSYIKRDSVAIVSFRGENAEELLQPTQSMSRARRVLDELLMGGATPLSSAIVCSLKIVQRAALKGSENVVLVIFSDGRANVSLRGYLEGQKNSIDNGVIRYELDRLNVQLRNAGVSAIVVDTESKFTSGGEGRVLAERLGARYVYLQSVGTIDNPFTQSMLWAT